MSGSEQPLLGSIASGLGVRVGGHEPFPDPNNPKVLLHPGQPWPPGDIASWRGAYAGYYAGMLKGSSVNWPGDAIACAKLLGSPEETAQADADGIAFLTAQKTSLGWMYTEQASRVYGVMHLDYALVMVRTGSPRLKALAFEWLDLYKFLSVTTYDKRVKRCLFYGERSAEEGRDQTGTPDELAAWFAGDGPFPTGNTCELLTLAALRPELEQLNARPLANPAWAMVQPFDIWVGDDGVAICSGKELNHNTPKVCGGTTVGAEVGKVRLAPPGPYLNREREKNTQGNCVVSPDGRSLIYTADPRFFSGVVLPLPANAKRYRLGNGTTSAVGSPMPAAPLGQQVVHGPGAVPAKPGIFARFLAWLRSL